MTASLEELREAWNKLPKDRKEIESVRVELAAGRYLDLLSTHTPEKIDALLKGEAEIIIISEYWSKTAIRQSSEGEK